MEILDHELISVYFPGLSPLQKKRYRELGRLYREWNGKINVISRKDIDNLYERHILHSLGIAKVIAFRPGTTVLDAGTGGGFPGVPLAIAFPDVHFHLVDSTAKKLMVVQAIIEAAGLKNVSLEHSRLEDHVVKYDFVVSRAVASLDRIVRWVGKNVKRAGMNDLPNGILYLKGGDVAGELEGREAGRQGSRMYPLSDYFSEPYFRTKILVHLF